MGRDHRATLDEVLDHAIEEEAQHRHSLARFLEDADEQLDVARRSWARTIAAVRDVMATKTVEGDLDDPKNPPRAFVCGWAMVRHELLSLMGEWTTALGRIDDDPNLARLVYGATTAAKLKTARYPDEIAALRAFHAAWFAVRSGPQGRLEQRLKLGGNVGGQGARAPEPYIAPWLAAVGRSLSEVPDENLLYLTYVQLFKPRQRLDDERQPVVDKHDKPMGLEEGASAVSIAHEIKDGGPLPSTSKLAHGPHVTAALLVAEQLGLLNAPWSLGDDPADDKLLPDAEHDDIARRVARKTSTARKALRRALQALRLDVPPYRVIPTDEAMEIARGDVLTGRELDAIAELRDPRIDVRCCAGVIILEGVREPCREIAVRGPRTRHPSGAWALCAVCEMPVVPARTRKAG